MNPEGSASFIIAACVFAALLSVIAGGVARGWERRLWLGIAMALALLGANKGFDVQAVMVAHVDAAARTGGWYDMRRGPQTLVVALLALAGCMLVWRFVTVARRLSAALRAALVVTTMLMLYALLGMVSLHAWDGLVSVPIAGVPPYLVIELAGPAIVGLCAVTALSEPGATSDSSRSDRQVIIGAFFVGWMLLPVAAFPSALDEMGTLGTALPGAMLITKAALLPPALLVVSLFTSRNKWLRWRPHWLDLAMMLFCASPLLHARTLDTLYLASTWLAVWLLGRVLLAGRDGRRDALALAAATGLALVPIALLDGLAPPWLYGAVYGPHPFQAEGAERYLGFRPVGFFEDGNQYGIWTAMTALSGIEFARTNRAWRWIAALLAAIALASQSVGAILLLLIGVAALFARPALPRWLLPATGAALLAGSVVYLSGVVPLEHIARDTRPGQLALGAFRAIGRGSLPWRISQDQRALPLIAEAPLIGHGNWDWWRPLGRRPWGLPMLVIGQYGVIGLALLMIALLTGALATLWRGVRDERFALAVIVLLAGIDALLNSTIYFPAVLLAGALASQIGNRRPAAKSSAET
jgi:hypothetical protein